MADYDSDTSGDDFGDDISTNVLLGYASKDPTGDDISQLGGHPTWLDGNTAPDGALAKCKVCNSFMSLLLQINGHLPDRFPNHERRLYLWACRRKTCRRKDGSIRGFRGIIRPDASERLSQRSDNVHQKPEPESAVEKPAVNIGETLFGVKPSTSASGQTNPFSSSSSSAGAANPFASASSLAAKPPQKPASSPTADSLPATFAAKARLASPEPAPVDKAPLGPAEPWPATTAFPAPYPTYYVDAETEYISAAPPEIEQKVQIMDVDGSEGNSGGPAAEDKVAFESTMDKTFQRFADRLAENPEQILRYEYAGLPLLYAKDDAVGKALSPPSTNAKITTQADSVSRFPRCKNCGAARVFELQLTPHAIAELEAEDVSLEGMDWGTIILGVCSADCGARGVAAGAVGYVEEYVGVQWEELASSGPPGGGSKGGKGRS